MSKLTTQSVMHATANSSERTIIPTKYFGNTVSVEGGSALLHTKYDNPSHFVQVFKIAWNLLSGGRRGATRSVKIASRSMSGTTPNPVGHCIVSKKHRTLATGYIVDARGSGEAICACRIDAIMLFACRMSEDSGVQGCANCANELGKAKIRFQM